MKFYDRKHDNASPRRKAINMLLLTLEYAIIIALLAVVWSVGAWRTGNEFILPSPAATFESLAELLKDPGFYTAVALSFVRVLSGVVVAVVLAAALAFPAAISKHVKRFIKPLNEIIKATPIVSFVFLAYIIFNKNIGILPVFITALIVFPVVYGAILDALIDIDREQYEVAEVFGCTKWEMFRYVMMPAALRAFISSSGTAIGLGWKAGIAAEALAASNALIGIGTEIADAKIMIETPKQFALTFTIIILSYVIGVIFEFAMGRLKKRLL